MSFYGQALYEFKKLFNRIEVKNDGFNNQEDLPIETAEDASFTADTPFDTINLNSGNRWVHLNYQNANNGNEVIISHSAPGDVVYEPMSFDGINVFNVEDKKINQLTAEHVFKTTNFEFDAAGHLIKNPTESFYRLPPSIISITNTPEEPNMAMTTTDVYADKNGHLQLKGGEYIVLNSDKIVDDKPRQIIIEHKTREVEHGMGTVEQLAPGATFTTNDYIYDNCGHMTGTYSKTFQLPITDLDVELDYLEKAVDSLQKDKADAEEFNTLSDTVLGIQADYLSTKASGFLGVMYDNDTITSLNPTFASTIGKVDGNTGYSAKIALLKDDDTENPVYSVGTGISALVDEAFRNKNEVAGLAARLTLLIAELKRLDIGLDDSIT